MIGKLATTPFLLAILAASVPAQAQFKPVGPAPYSAAVARPKIRTSIAQITPANSQQTITTLSGQLVWFREVIDDELIAAWKKDTGRVNLIDAVTALADARVAASVVEFSWHERREATFQPAYAPMFGNLMLRFPESPKPFLDDLLAPGAAIVLTEGEQFAVCRILLDMPDIGQWPKMGLQILPHYRDAAITLLTADLSDANRDKHPRAQYWMAALRPPPPPEPGSQRNQRSSPRPSLSTREDGFGEGTLECTGDPIPKDGEFTFYNVPTANRKFEFDRKTWDLRVEPGQGDSRNFILKNKTSKPQKNCTIRWTTVP